MRTVFTGQSLNASVDSNGNVALDFWAEPVVGQGALRGHHVGFFSADCNRMLLDNGEWERYRLESVQVKELLFRLATDWRHYIRPMLPGGDPDFLRVDWGDSIAAFLECVPNYQGAVPALYAGSAWMMRSTAALNDALRDPSPNRTEELRRDASALEFSLFDRLYVNGTGYFATVAGSQSTDPSSPLQLPWNRIDVRSIVDFDYIGHLLRRRPSKPVNQDLFSAAIRREMLEFVKRELITPDWQWLHALSLRDGAAASPLVQRADHGTTGSYDAWVSLAAEALADLSGEFSDMLQLLRGSASATREGCYGNNHWISPSGRPIKTLNNGVYIANNGVNFGDVIVRTLFGFDPEWLSDDEPSHLELYLAQVSRGNFSGALTGVRLPGGRRYVDIVAAGTDGLSISKHGE
jgi:hypothetical protein